MRIVSIFPTAAGVSPVIKFSLIIPTADRHYLLQHSLRALLSHKRDDVEIIVSDNYSSPETKAVVDAHRADGRLRYFRTDRRLPMPAHWDFAWSKARGRFVVINCDDDALSASGLDAVERAIDRLGAEIVSWNVGLYLHPDYDAEGGPNVLIFPSGHSNLYLLLDVRRVIEEFGKFDFRYFPDGTHFCIAKELGDKVLAATGRLFWPLAPDHTGPLLALAATANGRYCYIDSILGFGGRSKNSNAAGFVKTGKSENADRVKQFWSEFGNEDPYPHHALKADFHLNGYLAAASLLKRFYPQFASVEIDDRKFFRAAYQELTGIRPNPMINEKDRDLLEAYADGLDPARRELAAQGRRDVLGPGNPHGGRTRNETIRALTPAFVKTGMERVLTTLGLYTRTAAAIRLSGAQAGFNDSFELFSNWEWIVRDNDIISLAGIAEAFRRDLILSAHRLAGAR